VSYEVIADASRARVVLSGAVDILDATPLWRALLDVAPHAAPVQVELHHCVDVDAAVLQLLLALRRSREGDGRQVEFVGANERMRRLLARFGIVFPQSASS
jgi:ABC-type transporter Mla MlaB component